jgi:hypothetical protein
VKVDHSKIPTHWWETENGERWIPPGNELDETPPAGFIYQHFMFPCQVVHKCYRGKNMILNGYNGYAPGLAHAIANDDDNAFMLDDAIMVATIACERCMNVLSYKYDLGWGYPEYSDEWKECGTECVFCLGNE